MKTMTYQWIDINDMTMIMKSVLTNDREMCGINQTILLILLIINSSIINVY